MAIKDDTEYKQISNKDFDKHNDFEMPIYMQRLEIGESDTKRIVEEALEEFNFLKEWREKDGWDEDYSLLEAFYGRNFDKVNEIFSSSHFAEQMFNIHAPIMGNKVDDIARSIVQATTEGETLWSVSPRAEFQGEAEQGTIIAKKQEDWLEYKMTEVVPLKEKYTLCYHDTVLKGNGIIKWFHEIDTRVRVREEQYQGDPIVEVNPQTGEQAVENKGLEELLENHGERLERDDPGALKSYVRQLGEGKKISLKVKYRETIINDPMPTFVKIQDFYCDWTVESYRELTKVNTYERMDINHRFLKNEEEEGRFYNIDKLFSSEDDDDEKKISVEERMKPTEILMCVMDTKLKEADKTKTRAIFWISPEKKMMIGSILYPAINIDSVYVPFWIKKNRSGFLQQGIGADLLDLNLASNAIINGSLEGVARTNMITPIVEPGSSALEQFQDNEFTHGMYLLKDKDESLDFVNNHMKPFDIASTLLLDQHIGRVMGDASVSDLKSGRESAIDPTAPASKTLALIQQADIKIQGYIREILPSFNKTADIVLQYYHQITKEGQKYRVRTESLTGQNPFDTITRAEMGGRMLIESQASSFDFDKLSLKRDMLALLQVLRQEPIFNQNPENVYNYFRMMIKAWHPIIRNKIDQILPDPREFEQQTKQLVAQGVQQFILQMAQQAEQTGQPPVIDPAQLVGVTRQLLQDSATPPSKEEVKAREEAQEGAA